MKTARLIVGSKDSSLAAELHLRTELREQGFGSREGAIHAIDLLLYLYIHVIRNALLEGRQKKMTLPEIKHAIAEERGVTADNVEIDSGEKMAQVIARQEAILSEWCSLIKNEKRTDRCARILCISHGAFLKKFYSHFVGINILEFPNCSVSIIRVSKDKNHYIFQQLMTAQVLQSAEDLIFVWPDILPA